MEQRMQRQDAERYLELARRATGTDPKARAVMEELSAQRDSLMEAVDCFAVGGDVKSALELATAVWRLWQVKGDLDGARRLLAIALSGATVPSATRARALYADGV